MKEDEYTITMTEKEAKSFYTSMCDELIEQINENVGLIGYTLREIHPKWRYTVEYAKSTYEQYLEISKLISKTKDDVLDMIAEPRKKDE